MEEIDQETFEIIQQRGGSWACYENKDMSHPEMGRLVFLKYGDGCTYTTPPEKAPDSPDWGLGWRYVVVGTVDMASGKIVLK